MAGPTPPAPREWTPELIREQFATRLGTLFNGHVGIELVDAGPGFARLRLPTREEMESLDKKLNRISRKVNKLAREQKT